MKKGHIVPQVYQRSFAVNDQVAVHIDGRIDCVVMNIRDAATRPRFYRRTRPDGTEIDDIEASLSRIEDAVGPVFDELERGLPLDFARKNVLARRRADCSRPAVASRHEGRSPASDAVADGCRARRPRGTTAQCRWRFPLAGVSVADLWRTLLLNSASAMRLGGWAAGACCVGIGV